MADYLTDQEQMEVIKQWWSDYGRYIAFAIILGILAGGIWHFWHEHQLKKIAEASQTYQILLIADARMDKNNIERAANELITHYPKTPYADLSQLILAKEAIQNSAYSSAMGHLQWVIDHSNNPSFRQIARLSIARVLLEEKKTNEALSLLKKVDDANFKPQIEALKGDIYMAMQQTDQAKQAYALAQQEFLADSIDENILQLKLTQPVSSLSSLKKSPPS